MCFQFLKLKLKCELHFECELKFRFDMHLIVCQQILILKKTNKLPVCIFIQRTFILCKELLCREIKISQQIRVKQFVPSIKIFAHISQSDLSNFAQDMIRYQYKGLTSIKNGQIDKILLILGRYIDKNGRSKFFHHWEFIGNLLKFNLI